MSSNKKNFERLNKTQEGVELSSTMSSTTYDTEIADEWSIVPKIEAKFSSNDSTIIVNKQQPNNQQPLSDFISNNNNNNNNIRIITSSHLLSYNHVNNEFLKMYLTNEFLSQVQQQTNLNNRNENFFHKIVSNLFGPEKLKKEYKQTADFIYLLTTKQLDEHCPIHTQILITIYRKLTGSNIDCPRYGTHWENIGFQGKKKEKKLNKNLNKIQSSI
jgi:hypothetical protein